MSDSQKQCNAGHWYSISSGYDAGCPTCAATADDLAKTRVFSDETYAASPTKPANFGAEGKTVGFYASTETAIEPVVGWLACTRGPHRGQDWRLRAGRNYIGRSSGQVCLAQDTAVSRDQHAAISFDPRAKRFSVSPGTASGIAYLNGQEVAMQQELKAYDVIEVGNSALMFVPLVSADFSWERA